MLDTKGLIVQIAAASLRRSCLFLASTLFPLLLGAASVQAQVSAVPSEPQIGSSNPVSAEPLVSRPATKPCVVPLLTEAEFANFTPNPISYTPPSGCPGPWAKVVLTVDLTVTAGVQYDRTAEFILGGANIFYGTTAEPSSTFSPAWHVERDVTDLSAIFRTAQTGKAEIGNLVNSTYTGIIYANAALEFYPASWKTPAPPVPDIVVPVNGPGGDAGTLNTTGDQITQVLNLPTNLERLYLDVVAQSQSNDEFWYFCVPNDQTGPLESCGNTAFRETEISIDGKPAGVAPVFPWIFTGGIDPYLWEPITGVQTLDFKPYRVDLTPFAGLLSDGAAHTIAVGVYNADSYFLATANLLAYTDHGRTHTSGGLLSNTLTLAPEPTVNENLMTAADGTVTGTVAVGSKRNFAIHGYVETSHGRVDTTVQQTVDFLSTQTFDVNAAVGPDVQNTVQTSTVDSVTTTQNGPLFETNTQHFSYPLTIDYSYVINANGSSTQAVTSNQQYSVTEAQAINGFTVFKKQADEEVHSTDTLQFNASGYLTAPGNGSSSARYTSNDSLGNCYSRSLTAAAQKLTSVTDGKGCEELQALW
jgi:hypothetical protein